MYQHLIYSSSHPTQPPSHGPAPHSPSHNRFSGSGGSAFYQPLGNSYLTGQGEDAFAAPPALLPHPHSPLHPPHFLFPGMTPPVRSESGEAVGEFLSMSPNTRLEHADVPTPLLVPPVSPGLCAICQDRATGKHYGASSCDGCKGFFRRTIRKDQRYSCRKEKLCVIDKDHRNGCRYCRFQKCLMAGMRRDAVQNERDRIQNRRPLTVGGKRRSGGEGVSLPPSPSSTTPTTPSRPSTPLSHNFNQDYISNLLRAEALYAESQMRSTVITRTADQMPSPTSTSALSPYPPPPHSPDNNLHWNQDSPKIATVHDVTESMHQQLLLMVEWAKTLVPFTELSMEDQIILLRNYAAQHLLICVANRSRHVKDYLLLTNATSLPKEVSPEIPDVNHVTVRVLEELVCPMNVMGVDETEYVCLRAVVFFNPYAKGLEDSVGVIHETRQGILSALHNYLGHKTRDPCRLANLLLLLPALQAISQNLIEDVHLASMFGMARIDSLLHELMLSDMDTGDSRHLMESISNGSANNPDQTMGNGNVMFGTFSSKSTLPMNRRRVGQEGEAEGEGGEEEEEIQVSHPHQFFGFRPSVLKQEVD